LSSSVLANEGLD